MSFFVNDMTVAKRFQLGGGRTLLFRAEAYNVFNPVDWTGVDTDAQYNYTALNNARLADSEFPSHAGERWPVPDGC